MNTYAVVMQSGVMSGASQWALIGLSLAIVAVVVGISSAQQVRRRTVNLMVGVVVALVLAGVAATPTYAAIMMDCSWWGCVLDSILW